MDNKTSVDTAQKMRKDFGLNLINIDLIKKQKKDTSKVLQAFEILKKKKTDNLSIRIVLDKLVKKIRKKALIKESNKKNKGIYYLLEKSEKEELEKLIEIYGKGTSKKATKKDKINFIEKFDVSLPIQQILYGMGESGEHLANAKIMNTLKSKGLSADYVFYIIDDFQTAESTVGKVGEYTLTDNKVCEFLVGVTRTKERLVLIKNKNKTFPLVLNLIENYRLKYI